MEVSSIRIRGIKVIVQKMKRIGLITKNDKIITQGSSMRIVLSCVIVLYMFLLGMPVISEIIRNEKSVQRTFYLEFVFRYFEDSRMLYILPVVATLPYSAQLIDEIKGGYIRICLSRTNRKEYIRSKLLTTFICGGEVLMIGAVLSVGAAFIIFSGISEKGVSEDGNLIRLIKLMILLFLLGGLYSLMGLFSSVIVNNRYLAWTGAFIIEFILLILTKRYLRDCIIINPENWLTGINKWPLSGWSVHLWIGILTIFVAGVSYKTVWNRIKQI